MSDSNLEIKIDLKLEDEKAKAQLQGSLKELKDLVKNKSNNIDIKINVDDKELKKFKDIEKVIKQINKLSKEAQVSLFSGNASKEVAREEQNRIKAELNDKVKMYSQMFKEIEKKEKESLAITQKQLKEQENMYKSMFDAIAKQESEQNKKVQTDRNKNFNSIASDIQKAQSKIETLGKSGFVDASELNKVRNSLKEISDIHVWDNLDKLDLSHSRSEIDKVLESLKQIDNIRLENIKGAKIDNFNLGITKELDRLEAKFKELGSSTGEIDRIRNSLKELDTVSPDKLSLAFQKTRLEVSNLNKDLRDTTTKVNGVTNFLGDLADSMRTFTLGNIIGNALEDGVRAIKDVVIGLDSSITDMMKVAPTDFAGATDQLKQVAREASEVAKGVGQSTEDVIQATAKALQTGASTMTDAMEIARSTAMLANVGDLQQSQADTYIASIMSAYGGMNNALKPIRENINGMSEDYNQLTKFMDLANFAGNNFAISTGDVGEALLRSGAVLSEYGVSMQDAVSLIVGANESVQDSARVGTGLKTIATNLAGVKVNASEGNLELNTTAKALKEIGGIDVYSDKKTGQIKDMMTILSELRGKWKELGEDEQKAIGVAIAGKDHNNTFQAMMSNWESVIEMQQAYNEGMTIGSAEQENARYLDSVAGKINILKENLKQLVTNTLTSDFAKQILDIGISLTNGLAKVSSFISDLGVGIPTTIALITSFAQSIKALSNSSDVPNFGKSILEGFKNIKEGFKSTSQATIEVKKGITSTGNSFKVLGSGTEGLNKNISRLREGKLKLVSSSDKLNKNLTVMSTSVKSSSSGFSGLVNGLKQSSIFSNLASVGTSLLNGAIVGLASYLIGTGISAIVNYVNRYKELAKVSRENIDNLKSEKQGFEAQKNTLEGIAEEYDNLAKKANKTSEEVDRFNELKKEIAQTMPDLVIGYDNNNNPILKMNGSAKELSKSLDELISKKNRLIENEQIELGKNSLKDINNQKTNFAGEDAKFLKADAEAWSIYQGRIDLAQSAFLKSIDKLGTQKEEKYKNQLKKTQEFWSDYESIIEEGASEVGRKTEELDLQMGEVRQGINQQLEKKFRTSGVFKNLSEDLSSEIRTFSNDLVNSLDFTGLEDKDVSKFVKGIEKSLSDGNIDAPLKKFVELRNELEKTGQFETYEKAVAGLIPELSSIFGVNENFVKSMTKVPSSIKVAQSSLDAFLMKFGKREQMISFDVETESLARKFETLNSTFEELTNSSNFAKIDGKVVFDPEVEFSKDLPSEIQELISKFKSSDGYLSQEEVNVLIDIITAYSIGDEDKSKDLLSQAQEEVNKLLGKDSIKIDDINLMADIKVNSSVDVKELEQALNNLRDTGNIDLAVNVLGLENAKLYEEIIKRLPANAEITNKFIIENQEALSEMKDFAQVKEWLQQNPDIVAKYKLEGILETKEQVKEVEKAKNNLAKDTSSKVNVETSGEEKIEGLESTLKDVEGDKEVNVSVNDKQVLDSIDSIETLIKYSSQMKDGQYKLDIQANTKDAVLELEALEVALGRVSNRLTETPTKTLKIETSQASKNVTGLYNNIKRFSDTISNIKTLTFKSETAQASKNITGLINNVNRFNSLKPKTMVFKSETAQAAKNISGLIKKIQSVPTGTKTITYKVITKYETVGKPTPASVGNGGLRTLPIEKPTTFITPKNDISPLEENLSLENPNPNTKATQNTPIAITGKDIADGLEFNINLLKELEARLSMVNNQLSILDKKAKNAVGSEKIKYLQQQNTLYKEQMEILKQQEDALQRQANFMKYTLENKGFKFNSDGNMTNYEEMLIKKEKELKSLEEKANREKASDGDKKAYENAKKSLDELKKYADEYYKVTFDEIPKVKEQWLDLSNSIRENSLAIKELERTQKLFSFNSALKELSMLQDVISDKMDIINEKMQYAGVTDKLKYQEDLIKLLEEEQKILEQQIKQHEESIKIYQDELKGFGFSFDAEGTIKNLQEVLNLYKDSQDLEEVNKLLDEYFKIQRDSLPDARKEWEKNKNEIISNAEAVKKLNEEIKNLAQDSKYKDNERDISEVQNKLDKLEVQLNNASGKEKAKLLKEKIELTKQLQKETKDLLDFENQRRNGLMKELEGYGFSFRDDGSIVGYGTKVEELKKTLSDEEFNKVFSKLEDYMDTTNEKIPKLEKEILELGFSVKDLAKEFEKLERQNALEPYINQVKQLQNEFDVLANKLDIINIKMKDAYGTEKLELIEEQIKLLEQQKDKQSQIAKEYEAMASIIRDDLLKYGVEFDVNGDITNLDSVLNGLKDSEDLEYVKDLIDEYLNIQTDKLPDAVKEWESLNSAIKNAYKEQLNITKQIEDEITNIYKKQVEERKKLIDEELKKRLDAINKEKEAYNKSREEAKYQDNYNDQMDKIQNLEKQLEIAKKDTSLAGQKKVQDLLKQLQEEQKKLQDMVQDKIDDQVNDMFDQESDRLQSEADKAKEDLDNNFSDEKIQELVKQALGSGVFEDIDGTMRSLQDVMLEFVDKYGDGLGATGDLIKNELIANLEIAKNTMKDMVEISKELGFIDFSNNKGILNDASRSIPQSGSLTNSSPIINFNDSLINIEGNVDSNVVEELKGLSREIENNIINSIVRELR